MLISKEQLEEDLKKIILNITRDTEICNSICEYNFKKHSIPKSMTWDYISLRTPLTEGNEFVLYCIYSSIEVVTERKLSRINDFFTDTEIKMYENAQYEVEKLEFPLVFKAIQIAEYQWLTKIDFKTLMKYRAAQIINYNTNTQRTLKRIIRGKNETYVININKSAVEEICNLYLRDMYIPTPFTFNISDINADFYYNEATCELIINSLENFDIVDGYHRYLGACKACDKEKDFNFTMELRIINFPEDRAQQFIYQEDQKTIMKKKDSQSFNQMDLANKIVNEINKNSSSVLQGFIGRNKAIINYSELADLINFLYVNKYKEKKNTLVRKIAIELIEDFNIFFERYPEYFENGMSYKELSGILYCFSLCSDNEDKKDTFDLISKLLENLDKIDNVKFQKKTAKKSIFNEFDKLLK